MRTTRTFPALVLLALGLTFPTLAQSAEPPTGPPRLLGFDALQSRLSNAKLRLLDVRARVDYDRGHIPGAIWVDSKAAQALASKPGGLTDRESWQRWVAPLGIGPESEVIVIDGKRQLDAARTWWLLRYLGVDKVGLVDGNLPLWANQKRPVTTESSGVEPGPFRVAFRRTRIATRDDVLAALNAGSDSFVDARSAEEYSGAKKSSKRGGHIPSACHLEWSDLVDNDGRFLEASALRSRLEKSGIKPGAPVITHCQGGGRASVDAFVLERLGFPARNYYQGWSDWGNAEETPIASGAEPGPRP